LDIDQAVVKTVQSDTTQTPYKDLGNLMIEEVAFKALGAPLLDAKGTELGMLSDSGAPGKRKLDVTDAVAAHFEGGLDPLFQLRAQFEYTTDGNGDYDIAAFDEKNTALLLWILTE
jgi:hypothetical protein